MILCLSVTVSSRRQCLLSITSEQTQTPLILCALHTTCLLYVWIIKVHSKLWNASALPSPRHLLHSSAVCKHFAPLARPRGRPGSAPCIHASLLTSPALCFLRGWMGRARAGRSIAAPSVGPVARVEFSTVCGVCRRILPEWGSRAVALGWGGVPPPASAFVPAPSPAQRLAGLCVCVCGDERHLLCHFTGSRETGSPCPPHKRCPLWVFWPSLLYEGQTPRLWAHLSLISPFWDCPYWERKSGTGLSKGTSEIVAQLTSFFLWDTGEALDRTGQLKCRSPIEVPISDIKTKIP